MTESKFNSEICVYKEKPHKRPYKFQKQNIEVKFHIENKWEGIVLEMDSDKIYSRMTDVLTGEDYEFDFNLKDVNEDDRELVDKGAIFNFYTGYRMVGKTKKKDRLLKFRRRIITKNTINSILDKMKEWNLKELVEIQ